MKLMIFRLYMNFDELIFNHCAITNTNKNLINANVEIVPFKSRESFFFGSVYLDLSKLKTFADDKINLTEKTEICFGKGRKHCWKRRKCWLPAFSPYPTMFSKCFCSEVVKSRDCVVKR